MGWMLWSLIGLVACAPPIIERSGMRVSWKPIVGVASATGAPPRVEAIEFTLEAPTTGWIFLGFNSEDTLDGTVWIAARMQDGQFEAHERVTSFAFSPPYHQARRNIDGQNHVVPVRGAIVDATAHTPARFTAVVRFILDDLRDEAGSPVRLGKDLTVHLAYSDEAEWDHHSRMRAKVRLRL